MWSDAERDEPLPEEFDESRVAAAPTVIVGPIMHEVDGPATAQVWTGEAPASLMCIYDGEFSPPSGRMTLGDVTMDKVEEALLSPVPYRARLCIDNKDFPEVASLFLRPSG